MAYILTIVGGDNEKEKATQILDSLENAFTSAHRNLPISILLGHRLNPSISSEL